MPSTSKGYPYPAGSDVPDVNGDIQALAEACESIVPRFAAGTVTVTLNGGQQNDETIATFPVGRFTAAPKVFATPTDGGDLASRFVTYVINVTSSQAYIGVRDMDNDTYPGAGSTVKVNWFAVQ